MKKGEPSSTIGGNINQYSHYGRLWTVLKKPRMKLPHYPKIPLLGIYPEKTVTEKDTFTPVFTAALSTIAMMWKHHRCPSTDEWIKKLWYIYTSNITQP